MARRFGWVAPEVEFMNRKVPKEFIIELDPHVFDQESIGSCTSNSIITVYAFLKKKVQSYIQGYSFTIIKDESLEL